MSLISFRKFLDKYVLSYNLGFDDNGQVDDSLYINSAETGIKKKIDGSRPKILDK